METLNLPDHGVKTKHGPRGALVFDPVRRAWVALTPEEWVRQHVINHLVHDLGCPVSLMAVERKLVLNKLTKRADIVAYGTDGKPCLLVECKAPQVRLDQRTFDQAARYNQVFQVPYLLISNGRSHYCCRIVQSDGRVEFLSTLPAFAVLSGTISS